MKYFEQVEISGWRAEKEEGKINNVVWKQSLVSLRLSKHDERAGQPSKKGI